MVPGNFGCGSSVLATSATLAPSRAARTAIANPTPRLPPDMKIVLPARAAGLFSPAIQPLLPFHKNIRTCFNPLLPPPESTYHGPRILYSARGLERLLMLAQDGAGDDELLDLAGPLVDLGYPSVAVVALDRALILHVPFTAQDLDRV